MAGELQNDAITGKTIYFLVRNAVGKIWNTGTLGFETYVTANLSSYAIAATEQGTASAYYVANFPAAAAGTYSTIAKLQAGGSPAETDISTGQGNIYWDGTVVPALPANMVSLVINSAGRVEIQTGFTKNVAVPNFEFPMFKSSDHVTPATGLTVTAQRSIDRAALVNTTNTVAEVGGGLYAIDLSAADLNGGVISFVFSAATADTKFVSVRTDP